MTGQPCAGFPVAGDSRTDANDGRRPGLPRAPPGPVIDHGDVMTTNPADSSAARNKSNAALAAGPEATWPAALAVIVVLLLQLALPDRLVAGARWLLPSLEAVLLIPLVATVRRRHHEESVWTRVLAIALIAVINLANLYSIVLLAYYLIHGSKAGGHELILSAMAIWLTNVVIFGLWYWEIDGGGPAPALDVSSHRNSSIHKSRLRPWQPVSGAPRSSITCMSP